MAYLRPPAKTANSHRACEMKSAAVTCPHVAVRVRARARARIRVKLWIRGRGRVRARVRVRARARVHLARRVVRAPVSPHVMAGRAHLGGGSHGTCGSTGEG